MDEGQIVQADHAEKHHGIGDAELLDQRHVPNPLLRNAATIGRFAAERNGLMPSSTSPGNRFWNPTRKFFA
jgi:hypothetical protein